MKKQTYGIWGLGVVGKSVIRFLHAQGHCLSAYDTRTVTPEEQLFLAAYNVKMYHDQKMFLEEQDIIVPSPGISLAEVQTYQHKMIHELDIFGPLWRKPLIAVTGSLGKTTLVTLLKDILTANNHPVATGGNIGTPMLDLLERQDTVEYGLLELSSFQLEHAQRCVPDLAVITNLYANHLDRHGNMENYFLAKAQIFVGQTTRKHKALLPLSLLNHVQKISPLPHYYFSLEEPTEAQLATLKHEDVLYTLAGTTLIKRKKNEQKLLSTTLGLPPAVVEQGKKLLLETWLMVLAVSDMLGILSSQTFVMPFIEGLEHRIEFLGTHGGKLFYNDSKSTIVEATRAAVTTLAPQKIHLVLGGLSKGVDRKPLIADLKPFISSVTCFGREAQELDASCKALGISSSAHATLEEAFSACIQHANKDDVILFSPSGASYDLYKDYQERGRHFKELVKKLASNAKV